MSETDVSLTKELDEFTCKFYWALEEKSYIIYYY